MLTSTDIQSFIPKLTLVVVGAVFVECVHFGFKFFRNKKVDTKLREVIFFPDKKIACRDFFDSIEGCSNPRCDFIHEPTGFLTLLRHIKMAKKSIDICVYCISCFEIVDVVLQRHKVGVRVRVITDSSMEVAFGSQSHRFMKDGIRVQWNKTPFLMHHKFFIIDDEKVCFGSFNWTSQAVTGNNESVILTNDPWVVKPFVAEFQKLWILTNPH